MLPSDSAITVPAWLGSIGTDTDVVVSTRIRLARNLAGHRFPSQATIGEKNDTFELARAAFKTIDPLNSRELIGLGSLSPIEQQILVEQRVASPDLLKMEGARGVISDASHRIGVMVNEEDHLRLQCVASGCCPEELWKCVDGIDTALGSVLRFAFDQRRGFLTSCPTNSGTGLRVSFLLHLPGLVLTRSIDQVLQAASQMGITTRGFFGEHSEVVGSFFQLSNQATMGAGEEEFLHGVRDAINRIIELERASRTRILEQAGVELEDKIYRAYGILLHARCLGLGEFLNLASALRMGIECRLWTALSVGELNRLILLALPGHLQAFLGCTLAEGECDRRRADMIRGFLTVR